MRTLRRALTPVLLAAAFAPSLAAGQDAAPAPDSAAAGCKPVAELRWVGLSDARGDVARLAQVAGAAPMRPWLIRRPSSEVVIPLCEEIPAAWAAPSEVSAEAEGLELEITPVEVQAWYNSAYPTDRNNGVVWTGKGLSAAATGGAAFRWKWLSGALRPVVAYSENADFETVAVQRSGYSEFMYPWHPALIDWPQRFGEEPVTTVDPGQSFLRADAYGVAAGISTENLWWGAAQRYPILLSNTAGGFTHAFVGTTRPVDIWIGKVEAQLIWGKLHESEYYDSNPSNDDRLITGQIATFEPRGLPGLYLGVARLYHDSIAPGGSGIGTVLQKTFDSPFSGTRGNDPGNGIGSVFGRWVLPESGFEVYAEWAREDYSADLRDFLNEPDHSQAYMFGLQKVVPLQSGRWIRLTGEISHLEFGISDRTGRQIGSIYTHAYVRQGHTNAGQLLGAAIGPGSDAQFLAADLLTPTGRWGVYVERIRHDADGYHRNWSANYGVHGFDVEVGAGIRHSRAYRGIVVDAELQYGSRRNRGFVGLDAVNWDFRSDEDLSLRLGINWIPAWSHR